MLKKRIRDLWVKALRGGGYKQGRGWLRYTGVDDRMRYCCLGVLCDLHAKATGGSWSRDDKYLGWAGNAPLQVYDWAGCGVMPFLEIHGELHSASWHNDNGRTFAEIADAIERLPAEDDPV